MGASNRTLVMHRHNILYSSMGGKNLSRFVVPHGATVFGPAYAKRAGSRSEPNGAVYAPAFFGPMPFNITAGKVLTGCTGAARVADLGVHTNFSCLAAVDLGIQYGWYKGVDAAVWHGERPPLPHLRHPGQCLSWQYAAAAGAFGYVYNAAQGDRDGLHSRSSMPTATAGSTRQICARRRTARPRRTTTGRLFRLRQAAAALRRRARRQRDVRHQELWLRLWQLDVVRPPAVPPGGGHHGFTDPSDGGKVVYGLGKACITRSYDFGDTWAPCWNASGLSGTFKSLEIKDSTTMILLRASDRRCAPRTVVRRGSPSRAWPGEGLAARVPILVDWHDARDVRQRRHPERPSPAHGVCLAEHGRRRHLDRRDR